jgi:hypothetical protein
VARDAEVDQRGDAVFSDEHVSALDVPVRHPVRVAVFQRSKDAPRVPSDVLRGDLASLARRVEIIPDVGQEEVALVSLVADEDAFVGQLKGLKGTNAIESR